MCLSCSIKIGQSSNMPSDMVGIPFNAVMKDDFAALLAWAFCINPDKVVSAFKSKTGLDIAAQDLKSLITAHANGNDIKIYKINFMDIIKSVRFTQEERDKSSCTTYLSR